MSFANFVEISHNLWISPTNMWITVILISPTPYSSLDLFYHKKNATRPLKHRDENIEPQRRKGHKGYAKNILLSLFFTIKKLILSSRKTLPRRIRFLYIYCMLPLKIQSHHDYLCLNLTNHLIMALIF